MLSADDHDRSMSYVQTMAHQSLLNLIDAVAESGPRPRGSCGRCAPRSSRRCSASPPRVVSESREATTAEIQALLDGERVAGELAAAAERTTGPSPPAATRRSRALIRSTRDHFGGALFEAVSATAAVAVTAAQAGSGWPARATLRPSSASALSRPDTLRVGHILDLTPPR